MENFCITWTKWSRKINLINTICGLTYHTSGSVKIAGLDLEKNRKKIKTMIGLVPQELHLEAFDTVFSNVNYSRGLWGKNNDYDFINNLLKKLKLFEKRDSLLIQLSGGMKRRVLIAKALSHNPKILFLDEPSAGVDVELRQEMWQIIYKLKEEGVTIILTTHYIEEAEEIADRVGIINEGKIILVEEKKKLLRKLGNKKLVFKLTKKLKVLPKYLENYSTSLKKLGKELEINLDNNKNQAIEIISLIKKNKLSFIDFDIKKRSLESIFINFIKGKTVINYKAIVAIYFHEIERTKRTIFQSIVSPIITTSLYFIIFGAAIGSRIKEIDGVSYGMYIVPGLLMLNLLTQSISNGSFSTFFPKFNGTIFELQAAPISGIEMIIGFVGATASKSILLGTLIIITSSFFIDLNIAHPALMIFFY